MADYKAATVNTPGHYLEEGPAYHVGVEASQGRGNRYYLVPESWSPVIGDLVREEGGTFKPITYVSMRCYDEEYPLLSNTACLRAFARSKSTEQPRKATKNPASLDVPGNYLHDCSAHLVVVSGGEQFLMPADWELAPGDFLIFEENNALKEIRSISVETFNQERPLKSLKAKRAFGFKRKASMSTLPRGDWATATTRGSYIMGSPAKAVRVRFPDSGKSYTYLAPSHLVDTKIVPGSVVEVISPYGPCNVEVLHVGVAEYTEERRCPMKIKTVYNVISTPKKVRDDKLDALACVTNQEEQAMLKIESLVLVNGRSMQDYTDDQLFNLIAEEEKAVAKLDNIENKPRRLVENIAQRKKNIASLLELMNSQDAASAPANEE